MFIKVLAPTKQKAFSKPIFGFDCETYDNNKKLFCCSVVNGKYKRLFYNRDECIDNFKKKRFGGSIVSATNLGFDFNALFYESEEYKNFNCLWRGSNLLVAETNIYNKKFIHPETMKELDKEKKLPHRKLTFLDTMNYANLSVEKWGKILNLPKHRKPKALGRLPRNIEERNELVRYNIRDSEVSAKVQEFLFDGFQKLGGNCCTTIAQTAMSVFKNKYLTDRYYVHDEDILLDQFEGFSGGRTEVIKRGGVIGYNYYDVNSLYPFVMLNEFPNPNTIRVTRKNVLSYIEQFEGMSEVTIRIPKMKYQLLPFKTDKKLLFPYGKIRGWYTHVELRKALELDHTILKVHKTYYYTENCRPFYEYVQDLYKLKKKYKLEESNFIIIIKLLLNSLYGKWGQRFIDRDNIIPFPETLEEIEKYKFFEPIGTQRKFVRIKIDRTEPRNFCFPIWASYITSYARLHLYNLIKTSNAIYYDTDSIITKKKFLADDKLGGLKLEHRIKYGIFVRPKFYGFVNSHGDEIIKIKGIGMRIGYDRFIKFLNNPSITYKKFTKFREALRRNLTPNEIIDITKKLDLEDSKRYWNKTFNINELQDSEPIEMEFHDKVLIKPVTVEWG